MCPASATALTLTLTSALTTSLALAARCVRPGQAAWTKWTRLAESTPRVLRTEFAVETSAKAGTEAPAGMRTTTLTVVGILIALVMGILTMIVVGFLMMFVMLLHVLSSHPRRAMRWQRQADGDGWCWRSTALTCSSQAAASAGRRVSERAKAGPPPDVPLWVPPIV